MKEFVDRLVYRITINNTYDEIQIKKMKFGLACFLEEFIKFIIYLVFFTLLSLTQYFLVAAIVFTSLRSFAGGYHEKTTIRCFFITLLSMSFIVFPAAYLDFNIIFKIVIAILSFCIILYFSPVDHPNKPIISVDRRKRLKYLSLSFTMIYLMIALIINNDLGELVSMGVFVEAMTLPIGVLDKKSILKKRADNL
ncbi:hypothetical protein SH2C18_09780 [Clostridium sediminicola]|uniref:accessory gene regulator ArgB-like protein n=1 Tax=Clostridium sediminicola TaxID=3114879 RepID=UPI0031F25BEA